MILLSYQPSFEMCNSYYLPLPLRLYKYEKSISLFLFHL